MFATPARRDRARLWLLGQSNRIDAPCGVLEKDGTAAAASTSAG